MIINFRTRRIIQGTHKLARTHMLIKKITKLDVFLYIYFEGPNPVLEGFFFCQIIWYWFTLTKNQLISTKTVLSRCLMNLLILNLKRSRK
jgi:hypothetical protein